ncbi:hypothetical protein AC579_5185 [Pseudocercospora musae]|uniref:Uncharacterized protein n=1 Tax=Pseudocercospora musae TaxID=113226 RepID=A0A139HEN5_9PEZI|nr:hypothetical protein AC579_5185 [Pseudocercospora musae]
MELTSGKASITVPLAAASQDLGHDVLSTVTNQGESYSPVRRTKTDEHSQLRLRKSHSLHSPHTGAQALREWVATKPASAAPMNCPARRIPTTESLSAPIPDVTPATSSSDPAAGSHHQTRESIVTDAMGTRSVLMRLCLIHRLINNTGSTKMENETATLTSPTAASKATDLHTALYETTQTVLIYGAMALIFIIGLFIHVLVTYATIAIGEKIPPKGDSSVLKVLASGTGIVGGFSMYTSLTVIYAAAFVEASSPKLLGMTIGAAIALGVQAASMAIGLVFTTLLAFAIGSKPEAEDEGQSFLEQGTWPKGVKVDYGEEELQTCDKAGRRI